jgi:hypothetical protein
MGSSIQLASLALIAAISSTSVAADPEWMKAVGEALGKTGTSTPDGVYRVGLPRSDLKVTLDGVEINPALALGSWLAFRMTGDQGMLMGDLVLLTGEVAPGRGFRARRSIPRTSNVVLRTSYLGRLRPRYRKQSFDRSRSQRACGRCMTRRGQPANA